MIGFWVSAGAMGVMVAVVLVQALRQAQTAMPSGGAEDLAIYRDQLAEVDRDLARGVIPVDEADRLRIEVQRRILGADRALRPGVAPLSAPHPTNPALGGLIVVLALAGAGGLYWFLGAPGYPDLPIAERLALADADYHNRPPQDVLEAQQPPFAPPAATDPAFVDLIVKLRAAVASHPDDLNGQELLASNEAKLGNFAAAHRAQAAVIRLTGAQASADDYANLGVMMIYAANGIVSPEAEAALSETLRRAPTNGAARFYLGLMAAQVGRPDKTFAMWKPLLDEGPATAPWIPTIRDRLQDIADAAGIPFTLPQASGPSTADVANAAQMSATDRKAMIETMVGGLETRLMTEGGPIEDWTKLLNALGVLGATERVKAAYTKAQTDFAGKPGELSALKAAAMAAGVTQ